MPDYKGAINLYLSTVNRSIIIELFQISHIVTIFHPGFQALAIHNVHQNLFSGQDLREGKLGSCPGPPQLGGLHKNSKKIIT